jgi:hypothetical protein
MALIPLVTLEMSMRGDPAGLQVRDEFDGLLYGPPLFDPVSR